MPTLVHVTPTDVPTVPPEETVAEGPAPPGLNIPTCPCPPHASISTAKPATTIVPKSFPATACGGKSCTLIHPPNYLSGAGFTGHYRLSHPRSCHAYTPG